MFDFLRKLFHHTRRYAAPIVNPSSGQWTKSLVFQTSATAAVNGATVQVDGFNGAVMLEVVNGGAGTTTVTPQGSMDGTNWYSLGYQRIDGQAAPARAVGAFAVGATSRAILQVLDYYEFLQVPTGTPTGSVSVSVTGVAVPL